MKLTDSESRLVSTTAKEHAQHIAELLHLSRNPTWSSDQTLELTASLKGQSTEVLALGLLLFAGGLLLAARNATEIQREVAIAEAEIDEREGLLQ